MTIRCRHTIAVLAAALAVGCATDNTQRLTQARDLYAGTMAGVHQEYHAGRISRAGLERIKPYDLSARAALDAAQAAVTGDPAAFDAALSSATDAVAELTRAKASAEQPATGPVGRGS